MVDRAEQKFLDLGGYQTGSMNKILVGKKVLVFCISIFLLSIVVFYVARLAPGDPLISYYGERVEKMSP